MQGSLEDNTKCQQGRYHSAPVGLNMNFTDAKACVLASYNGVEQFYRRCHMANSTLAGLTGNKVVFGLAKSSITGVQGGHVWTETPDGVIQDALEDYWYDHEHIPPQMHEFLINNFYGEGRPLREWLTQPMIDLAEAGGNPILEWRMSRGV